MFHGQVLQVMDNAKYLGLEISHDLRWKTHIQNVTVKAYRTLSFIRRDIRTKHKGIRETAYNTLVRTQVEYASPVWNPYTQTNINKVTQIQRRTARWVADGYSSYSSVTQMLNTLGWRSLEQRRADARLTMFYQIAYGLVMIPMPSYIRHPVRTIRTIHPMLYLQTPITASYYKYSFFPLAVVQWSKTPPRLSSPRTIQVHCMHPSSLHAIIHDILFLTGFNLFSN